jgi:hypothetical protein
MTHADLLAIAQRGAPQQTGESQMGEVTVKKEKAKREKAAADQSTPVLVTYKGFGADWKCRNHQYAIGKSYELDGDIAACERGFHACEYPLDVLAYYAPAGNRFALVEQSGTIARHAGDSMVASSKIHIKAEITLAGLIQAGID